MSSLAKAVLALSVLASSFSSAEALERIRVPVVSESTPSLAEESFDSIANSGTDVSIGDTFIYDQTRLNLSSSTVLLLDQLVGTKILVTNPLSTDLRVIFMDKDFRTKKMLRLPESAYLKNFNLSAIELYPTQRDGTNFVYGTLILRTTKGDVFVDLKDYKSRYAIYSKEFFQDRIGADEISIQEISK